VPKAHYVNLSRIEEIMIISGARYQDITITVIVDVIHTPRDVEHVLTNVYGSIRGLA
jgi:hypothetical protein